MFRICFHPYIQTVTRNFATPIDHMWSNDIVSTHTNSILLTNTSDHNAPFTVLHTHPKSTLYPVMITYSDGNHISSEQLIRLVM